MASSLASERFSRWSWKAKGTPATSPVFSLHDSDWSLRFKIDKDYFDHCLYLENTSVPNGFRRFQVLCYVRRFPTAQGMGIFLTNCKSNASNKIWKVSFSVMLEYAAGFPLQEEEIEFELIFLGGGVEFPKATKSTGTNTSLDLTRAVFRRSEAFSTLYSTEILEILSVVVDIRDVDAAVLDLFLGYVYTGELPRPPQDSLRGLYAMADRYQMHLLKKLCLDSMLGSMDADNCHTVLQYAKELDDGELKDLATAHILDHPDWLNDEAWFQFSDKHPRLANEVYRKLYDKVYFIKRE